MSSKDDKILDDKILDDKILDDKILEEAKRRFRQCEEWEAHARENFMYDYKFSQGDSSNNFQWDDDLIRSRQNVDRPCLTVNKTRQHCLQIINDQRQNESSIEIRAVGGGASFDAASILEGIIRHIERQSNATAAYSNASFTQIIGGIGYWRIIADYANDGSFDQEIYIRRVGDAMSIYLDPDIQQFDASDAKFGFVFKDMTRDDYELEYGKTDFHEGGSPLGEGSYDSWDTKDHVRVCEYYRISEKADKLHELPDGSVIKESEARKLEQMSERAEGFTGESHFDTLKRISVRTRDITNPKVEWFLIAGNEIRDRKDVPGKYIPIIRLVGEETVIDRQMDRKGHVRALIDPQKIYNWSTSSAVEFMALQGKTPYIAPAEAIEGFEDDWAKANIENAAVLPYNGTDDKGNPIEKPERTQPPTISPAYMTGMQIAQSELMLVSGQYEATFGAKSNETSGRAVQERRRNGDNATYHYIDHFAQAIQYTGKILINWIPEIYDTQRIIMILGQDGSQNAVQLDPNHPQAHTQQQDTDDDNYDPQQISAIFNPNVGEYAVAADIGPSFATRRQDTFNSLSQIIQSDPAMLMPIAGDILFRAADFPLSDEVAERLRNMVPPAALGKGPGAEELKLTDQVHQQGETIKILTAKLEKAESQNNAHTQDKGIALFNAETTRLKAIGDIDKAALIPIIRELVSQVLGSPANPIIAAHQLENSMMAGSDAQMADQQHQQNVELQTQSQDHQADMAAAQSKQGNKE